MDDNAQNRNEISQMRNFMRAAGSHEGKMAHPARIPSGSREQVEARIVALTEHIYLHVRPLDCDDLEEGLHSRTGAVMATQTINEIADAVRTHDNTKVLELSRELYQHFSGCNESDYSAMLRHVGFKGEEYDLQGLVAMLGHLLADVGQNRIDIRENAEKDRRLFGSLVRDLVHLVNKWSHPQPVTSGALLEDRNPEACAAEVRELLEQQYGISLEIK